MDCKRLTEIIYVPLCKYKGSASLSNMKKWTINVIKQVFTNRSASCILQFNSEKEKKRVKLEQVEVHKYPWPAPLFNLSK